MYICFIFVFILYIELILVFLYFNIYIDYIYEKFIEYVIMNFFY